MLKTESITNLENKELEYLILSDDEDDVIEDNGGLDDSVEAGEDEKSQEEIAWDKIAEETHEIRQQLFDLREETRDEIKELPQKNGSEDKVKELDHRIWLIDDMFVTARLLLLSIPDKDGENDWDYDERERGDFLDHGYDEYGECVGRLKIAQETISGMKGWISKWV